MEYHIAKGVFDILPQDPDPEGKWRESFLWQYIESEAKQIAFEWGYREIRTPLFEHTELFKRGVGVGTDIVSKEMYTFLDKAERHLTLRPEGTAPVMRAFIEKRLDMQAPIHKLFYIAPMFRYERQQAGRYRQHHQFGVEAIGSGSAFQDAEIIHLALTFFSRLGLKNTTLHLNCVGSTQTRTNYRESLKHYLYPFLNELSEESQQRYHTNPLRILDSKHSHDRTILKNAPSILDFLDTDSKSHFELLCNILKEGGISYLLNPTLVRGLDYYSGTVFEVTSEALGAQNSICGGGRYDGLLNTLGGADLPTIGFGIGLERIIQTLLAQNAPLPNKPAPTLVLIPMGEESKRYCYKLLCTLRENHVAAEMEMSDKKVKAALKWADQLNARYVMVIGDNELANGKAELKQMDTGGCESLEISTLINRLTNKRK